MADIPRALPVEMCGAVSHCMGSPQSYAEAARSRYSHNEPSKKRIAQVALQALEAARAKDVSTHAANAEALAVNKRIREQIIAVMKGAGIPDTWSERDLKSRARFPKRVTHTAGYLGDLQRHVPISDGFDAATSTYLRLKQSYDAYAAEAEAESARAAAAAEQAEERRKAERRANIELAEIILRYDLDRDSEWSDVLDALRKKDQRLDLAVAMLDVRSDWSDGPDKVRYALDRFKIETDEDKAIANDIVGHLTDWDGDGRCFRDTAWGYDRLFASVADQQLAADVQTARSKAEAA